MKKALLLALALIAVGCASTPQLFLLNLETRVTVVPGITSANGLVLNELETQLKLAGFQVLPPDSFGVAYEAGRVAQTSAAQARGDALDLGSPVDGIRIPRVVGITLHTSTPPKASAAIPKLTWNRDELGGIQVLSNETVNPSPCDAVGPDC